MRQPEGAGSGEADALGPADSLSSWGLEAGMSKRWDQELILLAHRRADGARTGGSELPTVFRCFPLEGPEGALSIGPTSQGPVLDRRRFTFGKGESSC